MHASFEKNLAFQQEENLNMQELRFQLLQPYVEEVLSILEISDVDSTNLQELVGATQDWTKGDYFRSSYDFKLSSVQQDKLNAVYAKMDIASEIPLIGEDIDHVLVLGTVEPGNKPRLRFLKHAMEEGGLAPRSIVLMGGQRSMFEEQEYSELRSSIEISRGAQDDAKDTSENANSWIANLSKREPDAIDETDLLRASAISVLGPLTLKKIRLQLGVFPNNNKPVHSYELLDWKGVAMTLLHSRAVMRNGEPRHTTVSCLQDWAQTFEPREGVRVAVIGSAPHLRRLKLTARRAFAEIGRQDLHVSIAGPAVPEGYGHDLHLREIAQELYEIKLLTEPRVVDARLASMLR